MLLNFEKTRRKKKAFSKIVNEKNMDENKCKKKKYNIL